MQTQAPDSSALFLTAAMLICTAIAVRRSPTRLRTALYLTGMMLLAGMAGAALGWFRNGPEFAGRMTALGIQLGGIAASVERIIRFKNTPQR